MYGASWALLAVGAAIVGFSKAAIGGAATVAVSIFALVLPTRESTGVLLVLLMFGDLIAIWTYRRHADWPLLVRLVVPVIVGIAVGAVFLAKAPTAWLKPVIGGIVVLMALIELVQRLRRLRAGRRVRHISGNSPTRQAEPTAPAEGSLEAPAEGSSEEPADEPARTPGAVDPPAEARARTPGPVDPPAETSARTPSAVDHKGGRGKIFGSMAGFTTMVANSGGPVMSLYLLRADLGVIKFVGTFAWFFFTVNLLKLPVSISLGLVQPSRFALIASLLPAVVVGAVVGRALIAHIPRPVFEWTILLVALGSGTYLMFS